MDKKEIKNLFISKGILNSKGLKKFCWEKYFDEESQIIFNNFAKLYRSEDEAWFCLCRDVEPYKCEVCGELAKFTGNYRSLILGYNTTCEKCSPNQTSRHLDTFKRTISKRTDEQRKEIVKRRKATNKEKYGDENFNLFGSNSFKQNLLEKHGNEYYSNHEKARQTCLDRYGVDHNFKLLNSSEHAKQVWLEQRNEIIEKIKATSLSKYGVESPNSNKEVISKKVNSKRLKVLEIEKLYNCTQQKKLFKKYGQGWKVLGLEKIIVGGRKFISNNDIPLIEKYSSTPHTNSYTSNKEKNLLEYIKTIYNGEILENTTNIISNNNYRYYELDIYLPELKIAFEFNGIYWHSNLFKDEYYHQRKLKLAYQQGIQLIHIYENDWDNKNEEIKQNIEKLINTGKCNHSNWINVNEFNNYTLSEPECIYDNGNFKVYNEGKFIKNN